MKNRNSSRTIAASHQCFSTQPSLLLLKEQTRFSLSNALLRAFYVSIELEMNEPMNKDDAHFLSCILLHATCKLFLSIEQISHFRGIGEDSWQFVQLLPFSTSGTALLKKQLVLTTVTVVKVSAYWTGILLLMSISDNPYPSDLLWQSYKNIHLCN